MWLCGERGLGLQQWVVVFTSDTANKVLVLSIFIIVKVLGQT